MSAYIDLLITNTISVMDTNQTEMTKILNNKDFADPKVGLEYQKYNTYYTTAASLGSGGIKSLRDTVESIYNKI